MGQFDGVHSETLSAARVATNVVLEIKKRRQESRALLAYRRVGTALDAKRGEEGRALCVCRSVGAALSVKRGEEGRAL